MKMNGGRFLRMAALVVAAGGTMGSAGGADCGRGDAPGCAWFEPASNQFRYVTAEGARTVATAADWAACRALILENMQKVMGPLPDDARRVPLDTHILNTLHLSDAPGQPPRVTLHRVSYATETNDYREGWLLLPLDRKGPRPAMLCLHQSNYMLSDEPAGLRGLTNLFFARELAARGYVTLAPDYQTYSYGSPRLASDPYRNGYASFMMKGVWNHMRAVDLLQSRPEVDPERIGCIGHSLGGINTTLLVPFEPRIKAAVISAGLSTFRRPMRGGRGVADWARELYLPRVASVYQNDPDKLPFDFTGVLAAMAPRPVFVNAPLRDYVDPAGGRECVAAARTVYALLGAADQVLLLQPDTHHDFPPAERFRVYDALDAIFGP